MGGPGGKIEAALASMIVESAPVIVVVLNPDGCIDYANPFFEQLTGRSLEDFQGKEWFSTFLPERDQARIRKVFHGAITGDSVRGNVNPVVTASGEERDIEWHAQLSLGDDQRVVCIGKDVTAEVAARRELAASTAALRKREALHAEVLDVVPGGVIRVSAAGQIMQANAEAQRALGLTFDELSERFVADFEGATLRADGSVCPVQEYPVSQALITGECQRQKLIGIRQRDDSVMWARFTAMPVRDEPDGNVTGAVVTFVDVTQQTLTNDSLRRSEAMLRESQKLAKLGSWDLDVVTGELRWSDEVYRLFDVDQNQFGASYDAFLGAIHPEDRQLVDDAYNQSLSDQQPYEIVHRLLRANGDVVHVHERGSSEFSADGTAVRSRGTVQDITERVQSELALRVSLEEKSLLLREVHHRVKNNLQVISSLLHFQAKRVDQPEHREVFAEAGVRLLSMLVIHEKLYQSGDLHTIVFGDYIRALTLALVESAGVLGRVKIDVQVDERCTALALPIEIVQPVGMILCELITNVFKHAYPDGSTGTATVKMRCANGRVHLDVQDNGAGFPPEFDDDLASSFGWQLVRNLVAQVDGSVEIGSGNNGASVGLVFPDSMD